MNEKTHQKQFENGQRAREILEDPVFRSVVEDIQKEFMKAFKEADDDKALEERRKVQALEEILGKLSYIVKRGDEAQKILQKLKNRRNEGLPIDANSMGGIA